MSAYTHVTIKAHGLNLHVVQAGPPDGALVLLLHGYPEYWGIWQPQLDFLAQKGFYAWSVDLRGYHPSEQALSLADYTLDALAADVLALIAAAGRERATLVAHDWGGMVAFWTAQKHGARLDKLAVFNAPVPGVFNQVFWRSRAQFSASAYVLFFQLPFLPEWYLARGDYAFPARIMQRSAVRGTFTDEILEKHKMIWRQPGTMRAMLNYYRALWQRPSPPPANPRISTPTLLVWGARDHWLTPELAEKSIALCDAGRLETWQDSKHWSVQEYPERVNTVLAEFLGC
ncbi:MAG: alpha/beta hydrolase [Chloroflexi bacterium]|nr:alpha/beta hydrolase [Chloroflexota bacterium]